MTGVDRWAYEQDMVQWAEHQITLLRERRFAELDLDNLIAELESSIKEDYRELEDCVESVIFHLLKYQFLQACSADCWRSTLYKQRREIQRLIKDSPSLALTLPAMAANAYRDVVQLVAIEIGLARTGFPTESPYTAEQLQDLSFIPGKQGGEAAP